MKKNTYIIFLCCLTFSLLQCDSLNKSPELTIDAEDLLQESIQAHGGQQRIGSAVRYLRNDIQYDVQLRDYKFFYGIERSLDTTTYEAYRYNGGYAYLINGITQAESSRASKFIDLQLDQFIFLTSLPQPLDDNIFQLLPPREVSILDSTYIELRSIKKISTDSLSNEKVYLYIKPTDFTVHYFTYQLDGDARDTPRLRKAVNHRYVNSILFSDYIEYEAPETVDIDSLYYYFDRNLMRPVEKIELREIQVRQIDSISYPAVIAEEVR